MIDTTGKTLQQVSDEIAAKLIEQGQQCKAPNGAVDPRCAYGDGKGNHCGIGWLLPPEDEELMSFKGGVVGLVREVAPYKQLGPNNDFIIRNRQALAIIQDIHDLGYKDSRLERLRELRDQHALNVDAWLPWVDMAPVRSAALI